MKRLTIGASITLAVLGLAAWRLWVPGGTEATEPVLATAGDAAQPGRSIVVERVIHGPVAFETVLVGEQDEGAVMTADRTPARRMRYRYVDHMQWRHPERDVNYTVSVPRDEIVLVSMETN